MINSGKVHPGFAHHLIHYLHTDMAAMLFLTIIWLLMVALANPVGNFPINDDWAFAESVRTLLDTGHFVLPDWSAANIAFQLIWGALFSSVFGFSFTVLRASTLFLGLVGVLAVYQLFREMRASNGLAILGAMAIAANPIYFASSNSFMTDVPFFATSAVALLFLTKAIHSDNLKYIALGTIAAIAALMVRQLGLAIPIAFAFAYLIGREFTWKTILRAIFPLLICLVAQHAFESWIRLTGKTPSMYGFQIKQILEVLSLPAKEILAQVSKHLSFTFLYIGLFVSPLIMVVIGSKNRWLSVKRLTLITSVCLLTWIVLLSTNVKPGPPVGNILNKYGIGPFLQHGFAGYWAPYESYIVAFWGVVGALSIVFTALMFWLIGSSLRRMPSRIKNVEFTEIRLMAFFGASTAIYCFPLIFVPVLYDRYLLLPILFVMLMLLIEKDRAYKITLTKLNTAMIAVATLVVSTLTVAATHDYLSWNRARWLALDDLVKNKRVSPEKIDGGFEFNGMYLYDHKNMRPMRPNAKGWDMSPNSKGWWVISNEYLIAHTMEHFVHNQGYSVVGMYPVHPYLFASPRQIFVLHKEP